MLHSFIHIYCLRVHTGVAAQYVAQLGVVVPAKWPDSFADRSLIIQKKQVACMRAQQKHSKEYCL